jgi:molybdate transport system substrate-binding protein
MPFGNCHPGRKKLSFFLALLLVICTHSVALGEGLTVGVAANFLVPFKEIVRGFEQRTAIRVDGIFSSSGSLFGQIKNGAPYDLFLSADRSRPEILWKEGLAKEPFIYAKGRVVLWTAKKDLCRKKSWREMLNMQSINRLAIANPKTAPYGEAALEALKTARLWASLDGKLVFAQNVSQVFQYAHTRAVDAGFCALSSALSELGQRGCHFILEEAPRINQAACILMRSRRRAEAELFATFINSQESAIIKMKYGYQ